MINLCRAEILISLCFFAHGFTCPGYDNESEYQSTCHMNVVAAVVGTATGGFGLGVVHKYFSYFTTSLIVVVVLFY